MWANLRRLFLDGLLVMLPLALLGFLAYQAVEFFRTVVRPLVALLPPGTSILGVGVVTIAAVVAVVLVTLFFGLLVRWRARRLVTWIEKKVLNRVPMYQIAKAISRDVVDPDATDFAALIDVRGTGDRSLGILVEELASGEAVVFIPNAPSAATGTVHVVPRDRVHVLRKKGHELLEVVANRGYGLDELLAAD